MIVYEPPKAAIHIPQIDLDGVFAGDWPRRETAARQMREACLETGFFYVINHGVPDALMQAQMDASRAFFALPAEAKMALHIDRSPHRRGYEPLALQTLDQGAPPDLKESAMFGREADDPLDLAAAPNLWPDLEGFRAVMRQYQAQMMRLGSGLAGLLALSLDLPEDYFAEALSRPSCAVRLLRYPPQPAEAAFNQLGSGAHTDWGMLTLLLQDDIGGLEVRNVDGDWIRAVPIPGAFVVNLGDMIPAATGGLYRSNFHRVLNNQSGRDRYSIATFFNPPPDHVFDCVPSCRPAAWRPNPRTFGDHIREMMQKTYASA